RVLRFLAERREERQRLVGAQLRMGNQRARLGRAQRAHVGRIHFRPSELRAECAWWIARTTAATTSAAGGAPTSWPLRARSTRERPTSTAARAVPAHSTADSRTFSRGTAE